MVAEAVTHGSALHESQSHVPTNKGAHTKNDRTLDNVERLIILYTIL